MPPISNRVKILLFSISRPDSVSLLYNDRLAALYNDSKIYNIR